MDGVLLELHIDPDWIFISGMQHSHQGIPPPPQEEEEEEEKTALRKMTTLPQNCAVYVSQKLIS